MTVNFSSLTCFFNLLTSVQLVKIQTKKNNINNYFTKLDLTCLIVNLAVIKFKTLAKVLPNAIPDQIPIKPHPIIIPNK